MMMLISNENLLYFMVNNHVLSKGFKTAMVPEHFPVEQMSSLGSLIPHQKKLSSVCTCPDPYLFFKVVFVCK